MNLRIHSRTHKGVLILRLLGRVTMDSEDLLLDRAKKAADGGVRRLLVDLSGVDYVDSHGLGQMVACHTLLSSQGGQVRFVGPSPKVQRLLDMTGLPKILKVDPTLATSLNRLRHD